MAQPAPYSNPFMGLQTPEQIQQNRLLGQKLMQQGMSAEPVGHWTQGLARVLQAGVGRMNVNAADEAAQARQGATMSALDSSGALSGLSPADRSLIGADPEMMKAALSRVYDRKLNPNAGKTSDIQEFEYAKNQGFAGQFEDWMRQKKMQQGQAGLNLQWGVDDKGNRVAFQPLNQGGVRQVDLPPGVKWEHGVEKVDLGTQWGILDKRSGNVISTIPKNIAEAEAQRTIGEDRGKVQVQAPKLLGTQEALEQQHAVLRDEIARVIPELKKMGTTGLGSVVTRNIPGTPGYKVSQLIKTIKANVGFDKLNQMRAESPTGGALGQVAVQELEYLQAVLGSLEQAQDADTVRENLLRLGSFLEVSSDRRRRMLEADLGRAGVSRDVLTPSKVKQQRIAQEPLPPVTQPAGRPTPPAEAIQMLQKNMTPEMMRFFDEKYGPGAAKRALRME